MTHVLCITELMAAASEFRICLSVSGPGVVSGEAAQKVLSDHNVNFKSTAPLTGLKSSSQATPLQTKPTASQKTKSRSNSSNSSSRPATPHKLLRKGLTYLTLMFSPNCSDCVFTCCHCGAHTQPQSERL